MISEYLPEHGSVSNIVIYELSPLHHIVGVQLTGGVDIRNNVNTDQSRGG